MALNIGNNRCCAWVSIIMQRMEFSILRVTLGYIHTPKAINLLHIRTTKIESGNRSSQNRRLVGSMFKIVVAWNNVSLRIG
jgi:hypothetical protein